jgi:hypothetical protein
MEQAIKSRVDAACRAAKLCEWDGPIRVGPRCELHIMLDNDDPRLKLWWGYHEAHYNHTKGWPWNKNEKNDGSRSNAIGGANDR